MTSVMTVKHSRGASARRKAISWGVVLAGTAWAAAASAHHSFAVFFDQDKTVTVTGVVEDFRFSNPHGSLTLRVKGQGGQEAWKAETNSPSIMLRRGWTKDSLKVGDTVTITGWAARDGSHYLRMMKANRPDGSPIGAPTLAKPGDEK